MRFDELSGKIEIDMSEFISISRRAISPTPTCDEEEVGNARMSARVFERIMGKKCENPFSFEFSVGEHLFEMKISPDSVDNDLIILTRTVDTPPDKPRRDVVQTVRAEGFISAYALAEKCGFESIRLRIVYYNPITDEFSAVNEQLTKKKLLTFFTRCMTTLSVFATPEVERVTKRLPTLRALKFPYPEIRAGQNEFIRHAYRVLARGGRLFAGAPTGTGKTVSALFPALRALGDGRFDKIFYFTPKATIAEAVRDCLELMAKGGALVRAVILTAKEKACKNGLLCRRSRKLCPVSRENKLPEALLALYKEEHTVVDLKTVQRIAEQYGLCPYELSLAYAELCDVVVCDFNHLFDPSVYIRRFFSSRGRYSFLIDEAHNLAERVREAYSMELSADDIAEPSLSCLLGELSATKKAALSASELFYDTLLPYVKEEIREGREGEKLGAQNLSTVPERLYTLFDELLAIAENEYILSLSASDNEAYDRSAYLRAYIRSIRAFCELISGFDDSFKLFIFYKNGKISAKIFCLDTGRIIARRLSLGHSALLFSATLQPIDYYRETLGGERSDEVLTVESPFDPDQLAVRIIDSVSTRYSERDDTLLGVVRAIAATVSAKRGHYIVFSPSFAYSEALHRVFSEKYPKLNILLQKKDMSLREREEFLSKLSSTDAGYQIAFCVMGGIYSEGIDLAGDRLIGAIIVGIGLPSLSYEREAIAEYYAERYDGGKEFAYVYPGMNRVFQAAGRVIRREDDRGIIVMIDDRFRDPIYKKSLPHLWRNLEFIGDAKELKASLERFWCEE
jgi:Rad3-related DNA helicase